MYGGRDNRMKENNELTREDLAVDPDMELDCDVGQQLTVYLETWFDVDKKFGLHISGEDGAWLNMYAKFNVPEDTLRVECEISRDDGSTYFDYEPTPSEAALIKEMIREKCRQAHGCTLEDYIADILKADAAPELEGLS